MKIESLKFDQVTYTHDDGASVIESCTFDFPNKGIYWLQSQSGQGRSTILQLMGVMVAPSKGNVLINKQITNLMSFEEFLPYRLNIGYGFDYGGLINNRTLFDNMLLPLQYHKLYTQEGAAQQAVQDLVNEFNLHRYVHLRPSLVPGGVRKLVCILRSMILRPDLLLLDDPTVGLNQIATQRLIQKIKEAPSQGFCNTVYICSFDERFMHSLDAKPVYLSGGQLMLENLEAAA